MGKKTPAFVNEEDYYDYEDDYDEFHSDDEDSYFEQNPSNAQDKVATIGESKKHSLADFVLPSSADFVLAKPTRNKKMYKEVQNNSSLSVFDESKRSLSASELAITSKVTIPLAAIPPRDKNQQTFLLLPEDSIASIAQYLSLDEIRSLSCTNKVLDTFLSNDVFYCQSEKERNPFLLPFLSKVPDLPFFTHKITSTFPKGFSRKYAGESKIFYWAGDPKPNEPKEIIDRRFKLLHRVPFPLSLEPKQVCLFKFGTRLAYITPQCTIEVVRRTRSKISPPSFSLVSQEKKATVATKQGSSDPSEVFSFQLPKSDRLIASSFSKCKCYCVVLASPSQETQYRYSLSLVKISSSDNDDDDDVQPKLSWQKLLDSGLMRGFINESPIVNFDEECSTILLTTTKCCSVHDIVTGKEMGFVTVGTTTTKIRTDNHKKGNDEQILASHHDKDIIICVLTKEVRLYLTRDENDNENENADQTNKERKKSRLMARCPIGDDHSPSQENNVSSSASIYVLDDTLIIAHDCKLLYTHEPLLNDEYMAQIQKYYDENQSPMTFHFNVYQSCHRCKGLNPKMCHYENYFFLARGRFIECLVKQDNLECCWEDFIVSLGDAYPKILDIMCDGTKLIYRYSVQNQMRETTKICIQRIHPHLFLPSNENRIIFDYPIKLTHYPMRMVYALDVIDFDVCDDQLALTYSYRTTSSLNCPFGGHYEIQLLNMSMEENHWDLRTNEAFSPQWDIYFRQQRRQQQNEERMLGKMASGSKAEKEEETAAAQRARRIMLTQTKKKKEKQGFEDRRKVVVKAMARERRYKMS